MKLLKNVRNKVSYIVKIKSQKGIGGFLRKKQELRNQTEKNNLKTSGKKVKKKVKKNVKKVVLNKRVNKVKYDIGHLHSI